MTRRQISLASVLAIFTLVAGFLVAHDRYQTARADAVAAVASTGSGSGVTTSPGVHDPAVDLSGYGQDVMTAYKGGQWLLLGVLLTIGLDGLLLYGAKKWPTSKLGKATPYLSVAGAVLIPLAAGLAPGVSPDWKKLAATFLGAAMVYLTAPSAAKAAEPAA